MKKFYWLFSAFALILCAFPLYSNLSPDGMESTEIGTSSVTGVSLSSSEVAFDKMMDVLTHQRCVNCHPSDDVPKQSEARNPHRFGISRVNGDGATNCNTCHQASNNLYSGVPGAPDWALAPHTMRWEGLSRVEIARSMMDPATNGNRSAEDIMHHLTEHELVLWAWDPGVDAEGNPRELPPVPKDEYIEAVKEWIEAGAIIPNEEIN